MKRTYQLKDRVFSPDDSDFQKILANAYNNQLRPACGCCVVRPVELYVAKITNRAIYELRRMQTPDLDMPVIVLCATLEIWKWQR